MGMTARILVERGDARRIEVNGDELLGGEELIEKNGAPALPDSELDDASRRRHERKLRLDHGPVLDDEELIARRLERVVVRLDDRGEEPLAVDGEVFFVAPAKFAHLSKPQDQEGSPGLDGGPVPVSSFDRLAMLPTAWTGRHLQDSPVIPGTPRGFPSRSDPLSASTSNGS